MDNKKNATAVLDKPKTSNTPSSPPQQQQKINPKEEAKAHLTEDLIQSSTKRLQDALNKFKASESVRKEAHELSNDIAGRIRRISQTAKTEDAFRRDVDEFVSAAITYIINKARAENKKEKDKKEKEEHQKKEEEKRKEKALRSIREEEEKEKEKVDEKSTTEQQTGTVEGTTILSEKSQEPSSQTATQENTNNTPSKEEAGAQVTSTTTEQSPESAETKTHTVLPTTTAGQVPSAPASEVNATPTINTPILPTTTAGQVPSPTASKVNQTTSSNIPMQPPSAPAQKTQLNNTPASLQLKTASQIKFSSSTPQNTNSSPVKTVIPPLNDRKPVATLKGKNKAEVHMAIRHAIQQNAGIIRTKTTKEATNPSILGKVIQHASTAGAKTTSLKKPPEKTLLNTISAAGGAGSGSRVVQKTSLPGSNVVTSKKALPLKNFHKIIQPTIGHIVAEEYSQEIEGNDRGAAVTGNPNMQTKTEYLGSFRNRGDENFSVRKYFPSSSNSDDDSGGGGGRGEAERKKKKRRGMPGMGKGESKIAQQAAKSLFQAAMRSPVFWGVVIAILIILMLILIIIGIAGEKAKEDNKDTEAKLTLTKIGPPKATIGQNLEYTITANYPAAAEDLTIIDKIPVGVKYISSAPAGTYDAAARTVTWNAKALNVPLTNPVSMIVKVTLQAETDNITAINIATGEVIPSDGSLLAVTKTGPQTANVGQNAEYTINATYQGAAEDITIVDKIPTGVKYVSSAPAGIYDAAARTVTWNAKQLKLALANPLNLSVKVTLLVEANDVALVNLATATVKASAAASGDWVGPTDNNCNKPAYSAFYNKTTLKKNFGDPACNFTKDALYSQLKAQDPTNADFWFNKVVACESGYNPNAYAGHAEIGTPDAAGAWGLYQMGSANPPGAPPPAPGKNGSMDRGDVNWQLQTSNAIGYRKKINGFSYWACAR